MDEQTFDPVLLRTFLAVATGLSFTRAAEQLGLSQPTVSQHVRRLEEAAGRQLLSRDTRTVALTDNGEAMAGFARTHPGGPRRGGGVLHRLGDARAGCGSGPPTSWR